jgi:hypothetical protein
VCFAIAFPACRKDPGKGRLLKIRFLSSNMSKLLSTWLSAAAVRARNPGLPLNYALARHSEARMRNAPPPIRLETSEAE